MSTRRHVIMFQPRFAPLIEAGTKLQTIRPWRQRMIDVGDVVDLRTWTGLPYRSKQRRLRQALVFEKQPIAIKAEIIRGVSHYSITLGHDPMLPLSSERLQAFAAADGFTTPDEFFAFFVHHYTRPTRFGTMLHFHGQLIRWQP
jgi:hypothetical protein